jgi:anti-anti-sigma factor
MATRELEVAVRDRNGAAIVDLSGDVDAAAEDTLQRGYDEATANGGRVVLNFADTGYINSTGIALIVGLLAQARARGIEITACGLSEHYREIFEITRLADFMRIADDEDGAVSGANVSPMAERSENA